MFNAATKETQMKTPTFSQFQTWIKRNAELANAVILAQAFALCERERVDAYIEPLFQTFSFTDEDGNKILKSSDLYLALDTHKEEVARFYAACDAAHRAHGFTGEQGQCPALVAENDQRIAERTLLLTMDKLFGVDFADTYGEMRQKALNLALGACIKKAA